MRDPAMPVAFDRAIERSAGNPRIEEQIRDEQGRVGAKAADRSVDNINGSGERPTGTSAQPGIRRIRKAAEAGDEQAATALARVEAGEASVHV